MAFGDADLLTILEADDGVTVVLGSTSGYGKLLIEHDPSLGPIEVNAEMVSVVVSEQVFSAARIGDAITVNSVDYTIRARQKMDDGRVTRLWLEEA